MRQAHFLSCSFDIFEQLFNFIHVKLRAAVSVVLQELLVVLLSIELLFERIYLRLDLLGGLQATKSRLKEVFGHLGLVLVRPGPHSFDGGECADFVARDELDVDDHVPFVAISAQLLRDELEIGVEAFRYWSFPIRNSQ